MNVLTRKSLDELFDESYQYEECLADATDKSEREQLIDAIEQWLRGCAEQGRFLPLASADRRALRSLVDRWRHSLRKLGQYIEGIDDLADFDPDAGIVLKTDCPYPGLKPYTQHQRSSFFGREELVSKSVAHLQRQGNRILLIVGNSGTGKSSVAMAGILPRLKDLHGSEWLFGPPLTPGQFPMKALAASVAHAIAHPGKANDIERKLADQPGASSGLLADLCQEKALMLLIDQFEELLTLCSDEKEQDAFARVLVALSDPTEQDIGFSCRILLTLRTDHLARLENSDTLKALHKRLVQPDNIEHLSTIDFNDIKLAIKEPADKIGLRFIPPSLINQLANQTTGHTAGLPLLQFALQRLWETRPKNEFGDPLDLITEKMVEDLPNVVGALGKAAEEVFGTFTDRQKKICERMFLELLVLDDNFQDPLRRRRDEDALKKVLLNVFNAPIDIDTVIAAFVKPGLLIRFGHDGSDSQIEVAHEALLRNWTRIYEIVAGAEAKERLHLVKQIGIQSSEWQHNDRSGDLLQLRGERLNRALSYVKDGWLAEEDVVEYVHACREQETVESKKGEDAKWTGRFRLYAIFSSIICILLFVFCIFLLVDNQKKNLNALLANGYEKLKNDKPLEAKADFETAKSIAGKLEPFISQSNLAAIENGLGKVYFQLPSRNEEEFKENLRQSINSFQSAINKANSDEKKDIGNLIGYKFNLAETLLRFGDAPKITEAMEIYQEIVDSDNQDRVLKAQAQYGLGRSLVQGMKFGNTIEPTTHESAIKYFNDAFQNYLEPNIKICLKDLADAYRSKQSLAQAVEIYEYLIDEKRAIDLSFKKNSQNYIRTLFGLAQTYSELNRLDDAENTFNKILLEYPKLPGEIRAILKNSGSSFGEAHYLLGTIRLKREKYKDAIEDFTSSFVDRDKDAWVELYMAEAYFGIGDDSKADEYLADALELSKKIKEKIQVEGFFEEFKRVKNKLK